MSRRNFIILLTAVLAVALYPFSASAQKQDILGIKPGMEVSDLVEKMKSINAACKAMQSSYDLICVLPDVVKRGGWEFRNTFFLILTKHLKPQKVLDVTYSFDSGRHMGELAQDISDQFGEKGTFGLTWMWDLHDGYILTLGSRVSGVPSGGLGDYSLNLTNTGLRQLEENAADAERVRANPPTKF
jgi:hypothetical protein